jgi:hypothetical protein
MMIVGRSSKELKNQIFEKVKRMDTITLDDTINNKKFLE